MQETGPVIAVKKRLTIEWLVARRHFKFFSEGDSAELHTPAGRVVTLDINEWKQLAAIVRDHLGQAESRSAARKARPANEGNPWSGDDDTLLRHRWIASQDASALADEFGRSARFIRARLKHLGLLPPKPAPAA